MRTLAGSFSVGLRRREEEEEERQPHQPHPHPRHQRNQRQRLNSDLCYYPPYLSLSKTNSRIFFSHSGSMRLAVQPLKHSFFFPFPLFIFVCFVCTVFSLTHYPQNFPSLAYLLTHYLQRQERSIPLFPGSLDHTYHPQLYYLTSIRTRFRSRLWMPPIFFHAVFA